MVLLVLLSCLHMNGNIATYGNRKYASATRTWSNTMLWDPQLKETEKLAFKSHYSSQLFIYLQIAICEMQFFFMQDCVRLLSFERRLPGRLDSSTEDNHTRESLWTSPYLYIYLFGCLVGNSFMYVVTYGLFDWSIDFLFLFYDLFCVLGYHIDSTTLQTVLCLEVAWQVTCNCFAVTHAKLWSFFCFTAEKQELLSIFTLNSVTNHNWIS